MFWRSWKKKNKVEERPLPVLRIAGKEFEETELLDMDGVGLYAPSSFTLYPGEVKDIFTGITAIIPKQHVAIFQLDQNLTKSRISLVSEVDALLEAYRPRPIILTLRNEGEHPFECEEYTFLAYMLLVDITRFTISPIKTTWEEFVELRRKKEE